MACGCKGRMAKLEQKAPKVAKAIRPAHDAAMKVMDRVFPETPKKKTRRLVGLPAPGEN